MPGSNPLFEARIRWLAARPMLVGRSYLLVCSDQRTAATVRRLKSVTDDRGLTSAGQQLRSGQTGTVEIALREQLRFPAGTGAPADIRFHLADLVSGQQLATGALLFGLRRGDDVQWQPLEINKQARSAAKFQRPGVLWLTGLSGSGKSTIASQLEKMLFASGKHSYLLDGDNIRQGLNRDLGFSDADRVENIRRIAELARLMVDAGLIVITSFISPFRSERAMARSLFAAGEFIEIFIDTPLDECERRDPKGLYVKARRGEIRNFTGLDSPYEAPHSPELIIDTLGSTADTAAARILEFLMRGQA